MTPPYAGSSSQLFVIRLFQRHGDTTRSDLDEVREVFTLLRETPVRTRLAVGVGIRLANGLFASHFAGLGAYFAASAHERDSFGMLLWNLETRLGGRDAGMAVGVGLYRLWLDAVLQGRRPVADLLGEQLTLLSREAARIRLPEVDLVEAGSAARGSR